MSLLPAKDADGTLVLHTPTERWRIPLSVIPEHGWYTREGMPYTVWRQHDIHGNFLGVFHIDPPCEDVYFGPLRLGRFSERTGRIEDDRGRQQRRRPRRVSTINPV